MTDQTTSSGPRVVTAIFEVLSKIIEEGKKIEPNPFDKLSEAYPIEEKLRAFSAEIAQRLALGLEYSIFLNYSSNRTLKFCRDNGGNQFTVYITGVCVPRNEDLINDLRSYGQLRMKRCYNAVPA